MAPLMKAGLARDLSSPCVGVCTVVGERCLGCARTLDEIARWGGMPEPERQHILEHELPRRLPQQQWQALTRGAIERALHPLYRPPAGQAWNHHELDDLLPAGDPRLAAVLVGLVQRPAGIQVLLTRRSDTLRQHAGQVSFPGGGIDAGDVDAVAAALREAHEEIALMPHQARPMGFLDPLLTISGFRVLPVVTWVDPDFVPVPDPAEVAEVFEVPLAVLMAPQHLRGLQMTLHGRRRTVLEYVGTWSPHRIWGVTAAILLDFRLRLQQSSAFPQAG